MVRREGLSAPVLVRTWAQLHALRPFRPDGAAGRAGYPGQLLSPQRWQACRQGRCAGLHCSCRLDKGRMGSPEAARCFHKGRPQAAPEQAHRTDRRPAPARRLRSRGQQLAYQSGNLSSDAWRSGGRANTEQRSDPSRQYLERIESYATLSVSPTPMRLLHVAVVCSIFGLGTGVAAEPARQLLPTGQALTPAAAPGAHFSPLVAHTARQPAYVVDGAAAIAVSPDKREMLVLTSGYNRYNGSDGKVVERQSTQYVFRYSIGSRGARRLQTL